MNPVKFAAFRPCPAPSRAAPSRAQTHGWRFIGWWSRRSPGLCLPGAVLPSFLAFAASPALRMVLTKRVLMQSPFASRLAVY